MISELIEKSEMNLLIYLGLGRSLKPDISQINCDGDLRLIMMIHWK